MAKYLKLLLAVFFTLHLTASFSQIIFSNQPDEFIKTADQTLANTKNERSLQVASDFKGLWSGSGLSENNKKTIISLSQDMAKKRLRPSTHFTNFYAAITYGVTRKNLSTSDVDSMLYVTQQVLKNYDNKARTEYFHSLAGFLENDWFYASNFNKLLVNTPTFKIRYKDAIPDSSPIDIYDQALKKEDTNPQNDGWGNSDDHFDDWDNQQKVEDTWGGDWDTPSNTDDGWGNDQSALDQSNSSSSLFDVGYSAPAQPAIEGAVIEIFDADLTFITQHDSTSIQKTSGALLLKNGIFVGNGGTFDWSSTGLETSQIYVDLKEYNFEVKGPSFKAEPVILHYPERTDSLVEGVFEFQSKKRFGPESAQYPRFKSFTSNIPLKGIGENIEYYGGLSLEGRKLYSSSIDEGRSKILIKRNGEVKIKAVANRFEFSDSVINGNIASIVIYQDQDSIYHPGTILQYKKNNSTLRLTKTSGYRSTPFVDTYHKMEITVDALIWDIETSLINFSITNAANELPGKFESKDFFEGDRYARMQGAYRFHPLQMLMGYADGVKAKTKDSVYAPITTQELAKTFNFEEVTIKGAMTYLMRLGFIDYNTRSGEIIIREKAVHYVESRRDKKDYDNLSFESLEPSGQNATLDLDNKDLTVRGVNIIRVMDSLNIFIVPESKTLTIKGNRGFKFDGNINTANFQFQGKNFEFNYDSFLVHMPEIDKIKLAAIDPKAKGPDAAKKSRVLGNELRYSSGTLYINRPDNKSGRVNHAEYPIFSANTGASVFFNKEEIAGGVYDTTIRFKIPPFTVDSLASNDPQSIGFDGEFESGGIFPVFSTKLVVMPDFSMGFEYAAPENGFQLYEGKGKFFNRITMDNRGLTGNGRIEFLNTTCYAEEFHFFVDSVLTIGSNTDTRPGTNELLTADITFPLQTLLEYEMNWKPKRDSMNLSNINSPFNLYDNTAKLNGTITISERGMLGTGVLETRGSVSASSKFHFEETKFDGRNATFTVKSETPSKPAIRSLDCKLEFDLIKEIATFGPEIAGIASTEFPYLMYKTSIEKGLWDLKAEKVLLKTEGDDISNSYFYSTHPHQDSLAFNAKEGTYDMKTLSLYIEGVPHINVIDGRIFPDNNRVVIHENANMETLYNAKAEFDTTNTYHQLYDGTFDIKGRYKLRGHATYSYTNASGDNYSFLFKNYSSVTKTEKTRTRRKGKEEEDNHASDVAAMLEAGEQNTENLKVQEEQDTEFAPNQQQETGKKKKQKTKSKKSKKNQEEIEDTESTTEEAKPASPPAMIAPVALNRVFEAKKTVAVGLIYPQDSIEVAKKILYKGKVTMNSDQKDLTFDGFIKLDLKGALSYSQWLQFTTDGTSDVKILLEDPKADNGSPLQTGLSINKDSDLYTTFISEKDALSDFDVFSSKGILKFSSHPDTSIFRVASEEKFRNPENIPGNIFTYDDNNSTIEFSGKFNFIEENKGLSITTSGTGNAEVDSSFYNFNTMMVFRYAMHKTIAPAIAENLTIVADILPPDESEIIRDPAKIDLIERMTNQKILEIVGAKEYKNYMEKSGGSPIPLYEISKTFADGIVLSNVDLKWSNTHKAFYNTGKIKVANINGVHIDRVMKGYLEIRKTLSGDVVNLLIEPTPNNWYYFSYDNNRVAVTTSNDDVNILITKRSKGEQEKRDKLFFVEADYLEKTQFSDEFRKKYLGTEAGYTPERTPKTSEEPVEELNIEEEPEEEYIEQEYEIDEEGTQKPKKKQGKVIEEPELNRGPKEHSIEEKRQLQQDQQKLKDLFK
jgi:hypothetical protein